MNDTTEISIPRTVEAVIAEIQALVIVDDFTYMESADFLKKVKQTQKIVEAKYDPEIAEAREPYNALLAEKRGFIDQLAAAEKGVKKAMVAYNEKKEAEARAEQARIAAELRAAEEAKLMEKALDTGDLSVLDQEIHEVNVIIPAKTPVVSGQSFRTLRRVRLVDIEKVPAQYVIKTLDEKAILAFDKAVEGRITVEGVEFYDEKVLSSRGY